MESVAGLSGKQSKVKEIGGSSCGPYGYLVKSRRRGLGCGSYGQVIGEGGESDCSAVVGKAGEIGSARLADYVA